MANYLQIKYFNKIKKNIKKQSQEILTNKITDFINNKLFFSLRIDNLSTITAINSISHFSEKYAYLNFVSFKIFSHLKHTFIF